MSALKIVIDGRMYNESGIGRYIRNLIGQLQIIDKRNEYYILHLGNDYDVLDYRNNFHKVLADFRWYGVGEQIKLPKLLKSIRPDLVHFPHFNVPIRYNGKFVVTIHDLIHQHFSMERSTTHGLAIYKLKQLGYKKVFKTAIDKSEVILVPSRFVQDELIKDWKVLEKRITVTYEAVDDKLRATLKEIKIKDIQSIIGKFNIEKPYLFYVGNAHPHKNVEGLIRVFARLRKKYSKLSLVLSGNDHYFWQRIKKEIQQDGVIYTGRIFDEELIVLYKNAVCFVLPSLEEGFGIPLLEAMACSCPVVSSNAGSLPEVGKNAAIFFDPTDKEDMENKIDMVLQSDKLRKELVEKGLIRSSQFSWKSLAQKTLEVYEQCE